jgi:hypothetical protein
VGTKVPGSDTSDLITAPKATDPVTPDTPSVTGSTPPPPPPPPPSGAAGAAAVTAAVTTAGVGASVGASATKTGSVKTEPATDEAGSPGSKEEPSSRLTRRQRRALAKNGGVADKVAGKVPAPAPTPAPTQTPTPAPAAVAAAVVAPVSPPQKAADTPGPRKSRFVGAEAVPGGARSGAAGSGSGSPSGASSGSVGAPIGAAKTTSDKPTSKSGAAPSSGGSGAGPKPPSEERDRLTPRPPAKRHRRVSGRFVIVLVVILLVIGAAGGWYYKRHHGSTPPPAPSPAQTQADVALAGTIGIQSTDLPGWTKEPGSPGNAFAPVTVGSAAATAAQAKASTSLSECLRLPEADVTRAFGADVPARVSQAATPLYSDPTSAGASASSVVDVMRRQLSEHDDAEIFSDTSQFAVCYQAYAQTMLPYSTPGTTVAAPFTTVTVQPATVSASTVTGVHVQAFDIVRSGGGTTVTTTAIAIFGGRVQATLALVSPTAFPATVESSLVASVEGRVAKNVTS